MYHSFTSQEQRKDITWGSYVSLTIPDLYYFCHIVRKNEVFSNSPESRPSKSSKSYSNGEADDSTCRGKQECCQQHEDCLTDECSTIEQLPHLLFHSSHFRFLLVFILQWAGG
jgi:hypothetical protein